MKNVVFLLFWIGISLMSSRCDRHIYQYVPNNMVMPALQEQHDAIINLAASNYGGLEFQTVYSPLKYTAVMYNFLNIPRRTVDHDSWSREQIQEIGIGGYYGKDLWSFYLLGGYGGGFAECAYGSIIIPVEEYAVSRLNFQQWFIQPGFVLQSRRLRFGMAMRQLWLHYYSGMVDVNNVPIDDLNAIRGIEQKTPFSMTEFGLTLGLRFSPFTISYNSVNIFDNQSNFSNLHFATSNFNFMLTFDLSELWRKPGSASRK